MITEYKRHANLIDTAYLRDLRIDNFRAVVRGLPEYRQSVSIVCAPPAVA